MIAEKRRVRMLLQRLFRLLTMTSGKQNKNVYHTFVKQQTAHIFAIFFAGPLTPSPEIEAIQATPRYLATRLRSFGIKQQQVEREIFSQSLRSRA